MTSLRRLLLAHVLTGVSLAVIVAGLSVFLIARSSLHRQHDQLLVDRAKTLASLVVEEDGMLEFEYDQPLDEAHVGVLVRLTGDDGAVVAASPGWPHEAPASGIEPGSEPLIGAIRVEGIGAMRSATLAMFAARDSPVSAAVQPALSDRVVIVEVLGRLDEVQRAESAVLAALVVGALLALSGSAVATWIGVRRGLAPVARLGRAVEQIDTCELVLVQHGSSAEELRPVVSALQGLLARLREAVARERRFTDAAAHELRTPIAEIRTIVDVADRWPEPERLQRGVRDIKAVARQMEGLLASLLAAARGAPSPHAGEEEPIHLLPQARSCSEEARARTGRPDLSWSFVGDEQLAWSGPTGAIAAVIRNLVDNAAEYTGAGGSVTVRVEAAPDAQMFEIENGPVEIDSTDAERIFEPFWRSDHSRSGGTHRGLGLAVVDSLAASLRVSRSVEVTPDRRLRIRLRRNQSLD